MAISNEKPVDVFGATLTRRAFVKAGGALFVGISVAGAGILTNGVKAATGNTNSLDPALPSSWI
jgi:hypothetical protein